MRWLIVGSVPASILAVSVLSPWLGTLGVDVEGMTARTLGRRDALRQAWNELGQGTLIRPVCVAGAPTVEALRDTLRRYSRCGAL